MQAISRNTLEEYSRLLSYKSQIEVMQSVEQFYKAETYHVRSSTSKNGINICNLEQAIKGIGVLVFNMERGVHLNEIIEFLKYNNLVQPFDVILANELDQGCFRSANKDIAREIADFFGLNYVYGLEFIELVNKDDDKGFHGNAIFSRFPIKKSKVIRLSEKYNWYFDRQKRIGGRNAVLAVLNVYGRNIGFASIHLENRTSPEGRRNQMEQIYKEAERFFGDMPVVLGGDLNTNTFDGRKTEDIWKMVRSLESERRSVREVAKYEKLLEDALRYGYSCLPQDNGFTRRKPLPDGSYLPLRLDWIMLKKLYASESRTISTETRDFNFVKDDMSLYRFDKKEISDHNAVWANVFFK